MPRLIVAFAFGTPVSLETNEAIAEYARATARKGDCILAQEEVRLGDEPDGITHEYLAGGELPTLRVARAAARRARTGRFAEVLVVCARPHRWRCMRDMECVLRENGCPIPVKSIAASSRRWFYPESTQPRTRYWLAWICRESILRLMPFWLYRIVAS